MKLWKRVRLPVLLLVAYVILSALLTWLFPKHGLLSPDGKYDYPSAIATIVVLVARLVAFFVALPLLVARLIAYVTHVARVALRVRSRQKT